MANLTYTQIAPLLTEMYNQYTGRQPAQNLTFGQMQNTFKMGFDREDDNLYQIIPTVLAKSIYSIRPYSRKLSGMTLRLTMTSGISMLSLPKLRQVKIGKQEQSQ